jgi:hypothetical protein
MFGETLDTTISKLISYNARVTNKTFDLPTNELSVTFNIEHRIEKLTQTTNHNSQDTTFD